MLDLILDCFGVLVLLGQAVLFLVFGQIESDPPRQGAAQAVGAQT